MLAAAFELVDTTKLEEFTLVTVYGVLSISAATPYTTIESPTEYKEASADETTAEVFPADLTKDAISIESTSPTLIVSPKKRSWSEEKVSVATLSMRRFLDIANVLSPR